MKNERTNWSIVAMLSATATAAYICRVNVSTAGPLLMNEFGLSQVEMGRVFSAFLLGYALFQFPAGALADRWGARRVLSIASWLWVALTIMQTIVGWGPIQAGASTALIAFMVSRFLLGISEAPTFCGAAQGVSRWVQPKFQARANGIVIGAVGLGSAIAPILVSNVMVNWGWRVSLLVSAIPALIIALIWQRMKNSNKSADIFSGKKDEAKNKDVSDSTGSNGKLKSPSFILLTLSYSLQGYVGYIFVSWFYLYLVQERHFGLLTGAWMSSLPWILSIVSIPLGGFISDRLVRSSLGPIWGRRIIPIIGMGLSGILISIGAHTDSAVMAAISLAFATALVLCVEGPFWAMMINISGKRSGTGGGIMNMGCNIGGLISPALTPILATMIGWENALHVAAALAVVAALLWFGIKPRVETV
jgi:MFS transporter, ACS family, glucarate transporter